MSDMKLSVSEIKELMDKMASTGLSKVEIKDGEFALCLKTAEQVIAVDGSQAAFVASAPRPEKPAANLPEALSGNVVRSPLVGTYYAAPAPEKPDFVAVGQKVNKGDVLFIVESMKLMNEIQSEFDGTVSKILAQNGQAVEYGQPILVIE